MRGEITSAKRPQLSLTIGLFWRQALDVEDSKKSASFKMVGDHFVQRSLTAQCDVAHLDVFLGPTMTFDSPRDWGYLARRALK